ncbi:hypothetical protein ACODNH_20190 (plasmid) [Haloarcula sp. NS06]|uniref:hypothetical protein n=1 Tax=Haloarcula sp. NS06 TaxID=3409688 RepID=UPI003DA6E234
MSVARTDRILLCTEDSGVSKTVCGRFYITLTIGEFWEVRTPKRQSRNIQHAETLDDGLVVNPGSVGQLWDGKINPALFPAISRRFPVAGSVSVG